MAVIPYFQPTNAGATGFGGGFQSLHDSSLDVQNLQNQGAEKQLKLKQQGDQAMLAQQEAIKQRRLQQLLPMFNQGQSGGGFGGAPGGQNSAMPGIAVGGVYSPETLQAQINQTRASNDQSAATKMRTNADQMAGRGMSTSSPLMMALNNQVSAANMANNAAGETGLRFDAAGADARQRLASETARSNQAATWNQADIERRKQQAQANQSFMSIMAGLLG